MTRYEHGCSWRSLRRGLLAGALVDVVGLLLGAAIAWRWLRGWAFDRGFRDGLAARAPAVRCVSCGHVIERRGELWRTIGLESTPAATVPASAVCAVSWHGLHWPAVS